MSLSRPGLFLDIPRRTPREIAVPIRVLGWNEVYEPFAPDAAADQAGRCLDCGNPYCAWKCPVQNRIPQWLRLVEEGRLFEAATLAHETNPLPEICGRICPQDRLCEGDCTLEDGFGAVTIGSIEKYLVDEALKQGWRPDLSHVRRTGKRVAIVGAGPAGLACADRLVRAGIEAHVFDRYDAIGGLLAYGIPPFKLERAALARRREVFDGMGVRFYLGVEVGRDVTFDALAGDFDAVFLGLGTYRYVDGGLPGLERANVVPALPFLVASQGGARTAGWSRAMPAIDVQGRRVVVLGGGDTAMDCVRSAVRLGAASVSCVYRRGETDMPGSKREVAHARAEGVRFLFDHAPLAIEADGVRVHTPAGESTIEADVVIVAFGFRADPPAWLASGGIATGEGGITEVDRQYRTSNPKVFAGGDAIRGADLVVTAVRDGRDAADAIAQSLR